MVVERVDYRLFRVREVSRVTVVCVEIDREKRRSSDEQVGKNFMAN